MSENENGKKKKKMTIEIDLDALEKIEVPPFPENLRVWDTETEISPELEEFLYTMKIIMVFVAKNINYGPEIKDNLFKRVIIIKMLLEEFCSNLSINAYLMNAILQELSRDIYQRTTGFHIIKNLIQKQEEKTKEEFGKGYVA